MCGARGPFSPKGHYPVSEIDYSVATNGCFSVDVFLVAFAQRNEDDAADTDAARTFQEITISDDEQNLPSNEESSSGSDCEQRYLPRSFSNKRTDFAAKYIIADAQCLLAITQRYIYPLFCII